jgi:hypothetical protein
VRLLRPRRDALRTGPHPAAQPRWEPPRVGRVQGIPARFCRVLQRADGYVRRFDGYGIPVKDREGWE